MRKFLDFVDGHSWELSPLSYDEFERLDKWSGSSDISFSQWKRHNNFYELDQLSPLLVLRQSPVFALNWENLPLIGIIVKMRGGQKNSSYFIAAPRSIL